MKSISQARHLTCARDAPLQASCGTSLFLERQTLPREHEHLRAICLVSTKTSFIAFDRESRGLSPLRSLSGGVEILRGKVPQSTLKVNSAKTLNFFVGCLAYTDVREK
jgi:hypothetical protein